MEDTPAVRAELPGLNMTDFASASYDDHGFRHVDAAYTRNCDARVMFLGDSFTDGAWVGDADTFASRYAAVAQVTSGLHVCPVNAGVDGYGTLEEAYVLEQSFQIAGRPRLVFVMYYTNDVDAAGKGLLESLPSDADYGWRVSLAYLERMITFTRERGEREATLVIAVIPQKEQFGDLSTQRRYDDVLRAFGKSRGVQVIDLLDSLKTYGPDRVYLDWDLHFSRAGHQLVAEILYRETASLLRPAP